MRATLWTTWFGMALLLVAGCATGPLLDNPVPVSEAPQAEANPVYVAPGPMSYRKVFEHAQQVLADFGFEMRESNIFEGRIETQPRIAPGILQPWKPGTPDAYERVLSTFQTFRHRAIIKIEPAQQTGFFIHVIVYKEEEDLPRPVRATAGAANFRVDNNVQRQFTVVDPTVFESNWIPRGRDAGVEQILLGRLKCGF
jgi:hypothetical protein